MKKKSYWNENGWTVVQEADPKLHLLEVNCYAEKGIVTEVRIRHNRGEEEKLTRNLGNGHTLPMPIDEFAALFENKIITFGK